MRDDRQIARRLKAADFRELKPLDDFDWSFNPSVNRKQLYDLATCRFIREGRDLLLLGPPGVGKSFLVQAPGAALAEVASLDEEPKRGVGQSGTTAAAGEGVGGDKAGIPPHLRWEIDFGDVDTLDSYARKLDFFGIELGAYGVPGRGQVTYAKNLSRPMPEVRVGLTKDEKRLYMSWRRGPLKDADRGLAAKAGMPVGRMLLQFFSAETEEALLRVEHDFRDRDAATIRKTRFGIRPVGKGYEFFVIEQQP